MSAATTAYSTNMATEHNPAKTSSRRALGDLTPRAVNSPTQPKNVVEPADAIRPRSPLKKITSHIPSVFADKENFLASNDPSQSRKRGIEDVDDVETAGHAKMLARGRDEGLWDPRMRLTSDNMQQHTVRCMRSMTRLLHTDLSSKTTLSASQTPARLLSATRPHQSPNPYKTPSAATSPSPTSFTTTFAPARRVKQQ